MKSGMAALRRGVAGLALVALSGLGALGGTAAAQTVGTIVRLDTASGPIDIGLYDSVAPQTVANFLNYVRRGAYDGSFFHRLVRGFVIQGGGFRFNDAVSPRGSAIPTDPPVVNEFSATRSNLRATVAMAKLGGNPNSATNQWFVNLADNSANLDTQNGGFTVFGRVTAAGMAVVDQLAQLSVVNASGCTTVMGAAAGAATELPLARPLVPSTCESIRTDNLVMVRSARELAPRATASASDRIFEYLEATFPAFVAPASPPTLQAAGYTFRYYAATNSYLGTKDGQLFYLVPAIAPEIRLLGTVSDLLAIAAANGY
jgi:cyclophilin family peptidyl-prolyl cis-trans isomerase